RCSLSLNLFSRSIIGDSSFVISSVGPLAQALFSFHLLTGKMGTRPGATLVYASDHEPHALHPRRGAAGHGPGASGTPAPHPVPRRCGSADPRRAIPPERVPRQRGLGAHADGAGRRLCPAGAGAPVGALSP